MSRIALNIAGVLVMMTSALAGAPNALAQDSASIATTTSATAATVAAFKANPTAWLASAKTGDTLLSVQSRDLLLADPTLIQAMVSLAKAADPLQKANLGVGLAQAALQFIKNNDNADAAAIQQQIALAGDDALFRAFTSGSNAVETASLGTAAGTGGGGGVGFTAPAAGTGTTAGAAAAPSATPAATSPTGTADATPTFSPSATTPTSFSTSAGSTSSVSPTR
jgi:hypothetical protein